MFYVPWLSLRTSGIRPVPSPRPQRRSRCGTRRRRTRADFWPPRRSRRARSDWRPPPAPACWRAPPDSRCRPCRPCSTRGFASSWQSGSNNNPVILSSIHLSYIHSRKSERFSGGVKFDTAFLSGFRHLTIKFCNKIATHACWVSLRLSPMPEKQDFHSCLWCCSSSHGLGAVSARPRWFSTILINRHSF